MVPQQGGAAYEFLFAGLPETVDYYAVAGKLRSKTYTLTVVDVPAVKRLRVTYRYPAWTGMGAEVEDPGGDLRAVEGTEAEVAVETDRPLGRGVLVLEDGSQVSLEGAGEVALSQGEDPERRVVSRGRPGARRTGAPHRRLFHRGAKGQRAAGPPPSAGPGRQVSARSRRSRWPWRRGRLRAEGRDAALLGQRRPGEDGLAAEAERRAKEAEGSRSLSWKTTSWRRATWCRCTPPRATPGPRRRPTCSSSKRSPSSASTRSPSRWAAAVAAAVQGGEREGRYPSARRRSSAPPGTSCAIQSRDKQAAAENAQLPFRDAGQAAGPGPVAFHAHGPPRAVGSKTRSSELRQRDGAGGQDMGAAAEKLKGMKWQEALVPEQQALQHLLRAEATYRKIQVAFGNRGGGQGGGGAAAERSAIWRICSTWSWTPRRNQYETGQQASAGEASAAREIDEALQRLEQLARRQQELADRARQSQQTLQQRWQQEMLRREAEQLQQRMQQIARNGRESSAGRAILRATRVWIRRCAGSAKPPRTCAAPTRPRAGAPQQGQAESRQGRGASETKRRTSCAACAASRPASSSTTLRAAPSGWRSSSGNFRSDLRKTFPNPTGPGQLAAAQPERASKTEEQARKLAGERDRMTEELNRIERRCSSRPEIWRAASGRLHPGCAGRSARCNRTRSARACGTTASCCARLRRVCSPSRSSGYAGAEPVAGPAARGAGGIGSKRSGAWRAGASPGPARTIARPFAGSGERLSRYGGESRR